jgi:DNA-binding CsgD family transcriptional regulator
MAHTSLPGRQTVMRRLDESLMAVSAGRGSVTVVEGAAGLGKSRLLLESARRARLAGVVVAHGRADEGRRLSPLSPLLEAMRGVIPIPPVLVGTGLETPHTLDRGLRRLIERLTILLRGRASGQPILISLDDLQWADAATLLALQSMTELTAASPVMWLLTRRPWPCTPTLNRILAVLAQGGATSIRLAPLSPGAVAAMAASLLDETPDRALLGLLEKCAGNPLMVVELLRTLQEHDDVIVTDRARLLPGGSSRQWCQRITGELTSLSPLTRQMLEVASVFGQSFDIRCVAHVLRRSVADLLPSIHEVLGSELVVEEGTDLRFRCALVREAVYIALPTPSLRGLHREAADSLLAVRGPTDEAVGHLANGSGANSVAIPIPPRSDEPFSAADQGADGRLRALDLVPPTDANRPAFGWESLTEAELRVARLAARALTNREIADELALSPHTVESHLRHAFHKLDIRSRVELTRAVLTQGAALDDDQRLDGLL